jgi:hypothetical protein
VFTPSAVTTPVPVVTVAGEEPAPPPTTSAFAAKAALEVIADVLEKYGMPPEVPDVNPVPPLETTRVPVAFATGMLVVAAMFPDVGLPSAGVIRLGLVMIGLAFITTDPVPVIGLLTSCFVALLNTARDAVRLETIRLAAVSVLPLNVRFASPPNELELLN